MRHPALGTVCAVMIAEDPAPPAAALAPLEAEVDRVVVIDDGAGEEALAALRRWAAADPGARALVETGERLGRAAALNAGFAWAVSHRADWILLLDADGRPEPGMVAALARAEADYPGRWDLLAPRIHDLDADSWAAFAIADGALPRRAVARPAAILDNPLHVAASGSLIRATALAEVAGMREDFQAAALDVDFCLRLRAAGRRIGVVGPAVLHRAGRPEPADGFESARNRSRLWREWLRREPAWVLHDVAALAARAGRTALFGTERSRRLRELGRGLRRGLFTPPERWGGLPGQAARR